MKILDDARFTFYLLIDKKSKYSAKEFIPKLNNSLCKVLNPICVNWGGYSMINAELRLIEAALKDKQEILHFLQGADLPLKTPEQIDCFCKKNNNIFIDVSSAPDLWVTYKVLCKHPLVEIKSYRNNRLLKMMDHVIAHLQKPFIKKKSWYGACYYETEQQHQKALTGKVHTDGGILPDDNVRIYVPLDLNSDQILNRIQQIYRVMDSRMI